MLETLLSPTLSSLPGITHGFFSRLGGVSTGLYASLNCGLGSNDDRANVLENRARVAKNLGVASNRLLTCFQVHSATALHIAEPWAPEAQPKADAMVTRSLGLALGALAADCAPVLFADPRARVIAAAHAGWRGALGGILEATVSEMERLGADRRDVIAVVGPCIGASAYEVGPEFREQFIQRDREYSKYFSQKSVESRPYFNLPGFVEARLKAAGVGTVESTAVCTYSSPERFFSFRLTTHRQEPDYGRQISAIALL